MVTVGWGKVTLVVTLWTVLGSSGLHVLGNQTTHTMKGMSELVCGVMICVYSVS